MSRFARFGNDLYTGKRSIDFVGRQRVWYAISGGIIVLALIGIFGRGPQLRAGVPRRLGVPGPRRQHTQDFEQTGRQALSARGERRRRGGHQARQQHHPGADREAHRRTDRGRQGQAGQGVRCPEPTRSPPRSSGASWGSSVSDKARNALVVFLVLVSLVLAAYFRTWKMSAGGPGRAAARPRHHRRHLRPRRVRDHPGVGDRLPHDPRLLPLRHRRRVRQGAREHQRGRRNGADVLLPGRQPGGQPDPGPLDQHLGRGPAAGGRDPRRRLHRPRCRARCSTSASRCSSASRPAPTPRSSSPPRCWPTCASASRRCSSCASGPSGYQATRRPRRPGAPRPRRGRPDEATGAEAGPSPATP